MDITFPALTTLNNNVQMAFNDQLYAAPSIYKDFCFEVNSTGDSEVYPRLDMLPGVREWIGARVVNSLSQETFSIPNRTFEETIGVRREQLEDDKYGMLAPAAKQLGQDAGNLPDKLVASLFKNGTTTTWVDGQDFFSASHVSFPNTGSAQTNSNYQAGGSTSWYLIDDSHVLKPFVFQKRRPFSITARFSMTDPSVFDNNEFLWGTDGRCAAGYGLYQLIFRSDAPLNLANLIAARNTMGLWKRPDGSPMGITPTKLVVPTSLYPTALGYATNDYDPNPVSATQLAPNTFKGLVKAVENRWLN
jgi:phage major head subunit gpT-like protein